MSDFIIRVENLGKRYSIQHHQERQRYVALRDVLARKATAPLRWLRNQTSAFRSQTSASTNGNGSSPLPLSALDSGPAPSPLALSPLPDARSSLLPAPGSLLTANGSVLPANDSRPPSPAVGQPPTEDFWALKDVSFEVKQGEVVGIIGRNGAGKSTLLKILSRITEPTEGRVRLRGRVASLLEVGTGFHPELTGRENIFVNGAILGMTRAEIAKKFDEIVAFAEVDKFLDTPVKRYSSGMYVRLAFAVAANLEPEILIVDEVLAVGDAQFQKKCLGKMGDVSAREGRTVIFVSHNMSAIKTLCTKAIVMEKGEIISQGKVLDSLTAYLAMDKSGLSNGTRFVRDPVPIAKRVFIDKIVMIDDQTLNYFCLHLCIDIQSGENARIGINIRLKDGMGFPVGAGFTHYHTPQLHFIRVGTNKLEIVTTKISLAIGNYKLSVEVVVPGVETLDTVEDGVQFEVNNDGAAKRDYGIDQNWGFGSHEIKFSRITSI